MSLHEMPKKRSTGNTRNCGPDILPPADFGPLKKINNYFYPALEKIMKHNSKINLENGKLMDSVSKVTEVKALVPPVETKKKEKTERGVRFTNWCFTLFSDEKNPPEFDPVHMKFMAYGSEICPTTGKHHWQGYCCMYEQRAFTAMIKYFGDGRHVEGMKGSLTSNQDYCSKDGKYTEFGIKPQQGRRLDLEFINNEIQTGKINPDGIIINHPMMYHQYGRTIEKSHDLYMMNIWRTTMTRGVWIVGGTDVGKSHTILQDYNPKTHYQHPLGDNGWWDGYRQQPIVVFNEFRGEIKFSELLIIVDKWAHSVKRRNKAPLPFTSKIVVITSPQGPEDIYIRESMEGEKDNLKQLLRRFIVVYKNSRDQIIDPSLFEY